MTPPSGPAGLRAVSTWVAAGLALGSGIVASAAPLSSATSGLGAGYTAIPHCASSGIVVLETVSGTSITGVSLSRLDPACAGALVQVAVAVGSGTVGTGSGTVPAAGPVTVGITPAVPLVGNAEVDVAIVGP